MINTIIYFTNKDSLIRTLKVNYLWLDDFLTDNQVSVKKPITSESGKKIYLIYDGLSREEFDKEWRIISEDVGDFIFYYHSQPEADTGIISALKPKCKCEDKGSHEDKLPGYEYYESLKDIIEKELTDEKFNNLVQLCVGNQTIDEAIDLLHRIYNGEVINPDNLSGELKTQFKEHYNIIEKYKDKYEAKLVALRDAIVKKKITNQN